MTSIAATKGRLLSFNPFGEQLSLPLIYTLFAATHGGGWVNVGLQTQLIEQRLLRYRTYLEGVGGFGEPTKKGRLLLKSLKAEGYKWQWEDPYAEDKGVAHLELPDGSTLFRARGELYPPGQWD